MATFNNPGMQDINTSLPSIQVADSGVKTTTAAAISGAGQIAATGYSEYAKYAGERDAQEVKNQLNQDLQTAETNGNTGEWLNSQFSELSASNKELASLRGTLGNFATAEQQRKGVSLLYQIRSEAALKKAIRRAPGLRKEIAAVVTDTLGIDPTGATINLLLKGIENEGRGTGRKTAKEVLADEMATVVAASGNSVPFNDDNSINYDQIKPMYETITRIETNKKDLAYKREQGLIKDSEYASQSIDLITQEIGLSVGNVSNSLSMIASEANNSADFATFKQGVNPVLSNLITSIESAYRSRASQLSINPANKEAFQKELDNAIKNQTSGLRAVLEDDDPTQFKTTIAIHNALFKETSMSWEQQNELMTVIRDSMPGLINMVQGSLVAADPKLGDNIRDMVKDGLRLDAKQLRTVQVNNLIGVLAEKKAFETLDIDGKRAVARDSLKTLTTSLNETDLNKLSSMDYNTLAVAYATSMQLKDNVNSEDRLVLTNATVDPKLYDLVTHLKNEGETGIVKAEVIADTVLSFITDQLRGQLSQDLSLSVNADYSFDLDTGKLSGSLPEEGIKVGRSYLRQRDKVANNVKLFNQSIDTLDRYKEHDPALANLSREQIAQLVVAGPLQENGVQLKGTFKELPKPPEAPAKQTYADTVDGIKEEMARLQERLLLLNNTRK